MAANPTVSDSAAAVDEPAQDVAAHRVRAKQVQGRRAVRLRRDSVRQQSRGRLHLIQGSAGTSRGAAMAITIDDQHDQARRAERVCSG
jgi:hypothetical protein